jgi:hypothetical protein
MAFRLVMHPLAGAVLAAMTPHCLHFWLKADANYRPAIFPVTTSADD